VDRVSSPEPVDYGEGKKKVVLVDCECRIILSGVLWPEGFRYEESRGIMTF